MKLLTPLTSCSLLLAAAPLTAQESTVESRIDLLVERLEQLAHEHHVPGMGLAIVTPEGVFTRGIGTADLAQERAVTPETIFEIASVTKTFTGVLVARIAAEGKLDFDDLVREHVPYFHLKDPQADEEVTLRDLLAHRTGVTRTDTMLNGMHQLTAEDIARQLGKAEPLAPFRRQFLYNNQMYLVVGLATEHAGGASYAELLDRYVFDPLAMDSSTVDLTAALTGERMSAGYRWREAEQEHEALPTRGIAVCAPAGAILSTPADMARYLSFLLAPGEGIDGAVLLPGEMFEEELWKAQIPTGPESGYGLGFNLGKWRGRTLIHHDGGLDGFTSTLALLPEEGIGFSLLTNAEFSAVPQRSVDIAFATLLGEEVQAVADGGVEAPYTPDELDEFTGSYDFAVAKLNWTVRVDAAGRLTIDYPDVAVYTLAWPDDAGRWAISPEAHVVFDRETGGDVTALTLHHGTTEIRMPRKAITGLPSVDDVLALTADALPAAAVAEARPLRLVGSVELVHEGLSGRIEVLYQDDEHWRLDKDFGKFGRITAVVNGDAGWSFTSLRGRETMSVAEYAAARRETPFSSLSATRDLYGSFRVVDVDGEGDDERILLRAVPLDGPAVILHLDPGGSVRRADASFALGELATLPIRTNYDDVREVHGMHLAHRVEVHNPLTGLTRVVTERVERNVEIPPATWTPAGQDELPSAEEILDTYTRVTGGKEAYAELRNRVEELTVEPVGSGLSIAMTAYYARPDRTYFLIEAAAIGKIERGTIDGVAWEVSSASGAVLEHGAKREGSLRAGKFDRIPAWRELFEKVECLGVEEIDDKPCYRVVLTPAAGTPETHHYDRESGLLLKAEGTADDHVPFALIPGDYREVDGVLYPHEYRRVSLGREMVFRVKSIRHDVDLPPDRFALPDEIRALIERDEPHSSQLQLESFDRVWSLVNDHYWDPEFGGLDWRAVREELRPKVVEAAGPAEVRAILGDMIARLGVSHFGIVPGNDAPAAEPQPRATEGPGGETGIDARVLAGKALVTAVLAGSTAEGAGVRTGWEIVRIEDLDVVERLRSLAATLPDTPSRRVKMAGEVVARVRSGRGDSLAVTFRDGAGERVELTIPFGAPSGRLAEVGNFGHARVRVDVETLDENIGYIAVNKFLDPAHVLKTFNSAMESFLNAEGVVLDLRGNGGGKDLIAMVMLGWFAPETYVAGRIRTRGGEMPMTVRPRSTTYDGPVAVLTDGLTGSSAEFVAAALQESGRACILGTRTKGEALPAQYTTLPNGDVFLYAVADFVTGAGQRLEGIGVTPDIDVALTRTSLLEGRDLVLEAALAWVREQD